MGTGQLEIALGKGRKTRQGRASERKGGQRESLGLGWRWAGMGLAGVIHQHRVHSKKKKKISSFLRTICYSF